MHRGFRMNNRNNFASLIKGDWRHRSTAKASFFKSADKFFMAAKKDEIYKPQKTPNDQFFMLIYPMQSKPARSCNFSQDLHLKILKKCLKNPLEN
jgi:hypothetical protein